MKKYHDFMMPETPFEVVLLTCWFIVQCAILIPAIAFMMLAACVHRIIIPEDWQKE